MGLFFLFIFNSLIFFNFYNIFNLVNQRNKQEIENFNLVVESEELTDLGDYFISMINSPYKEVQYLIQLQN